MPAYIHICYHICIWPCLFCCVAKSGVECPPRNLFASHGTSLQAKNEDMFHTTSYFSWKHNVLPPKKTCSVRTVLNNKKETRICTQQTQKQVHAAYALASKNMNLMKTCNFNPAKTIVKMQNACGVRTGLKQKKTDSHPKTTFYRKNKKPLRRTHWPNKKKRLRQYAWDEKTKKTNHKQKKGRGL